MPKKYTHVKVFEKEIMAMKAEGRTHREIADHFGFRDKYVVKEFKDGKRAFAGFSSSRWKEVKANVKYLKPTE